MRAMRYLLLLLAACAPVPPSDASRAEACRAAFQSYDRSVAFDGPGGFLGPPPPIVLNDEPARGLARSRIQQLGCLSFPSEVRDPASVELNRFALAPGDAAPRQYLHVGILTSNETEAGLRAAFELLGYPVRVKGAELLGRRFFVGPLTSRTGQANASSAAQALGFESAYFLTRVP